MRVPALLIILAALTVPVLADPDRGLIISAEGHVDKTGTQLKVVFHNYSRDPITNLRLSRFQLANVRLSPTFFERIAGDDSYTLSFDLRGRRIPLNDSTRVAVTGTYERGTRCTYFRFEIPLDNYQR